MKNLIIAVLLVTTLVFGSLAFKQSQKSAQIEVEAVSLREQLAESQAKLQQEEKQVVTLRNNLLETQTESVAKSGGAASPKGAMTNGTANGESNSQNAANGMAGMFKSKEMRDMIRSQQKLVFGPMIDKNYASFFNSLGLDAEQTATLKDLLLKKSMAGAELGMSLMSGDIDAEKRKEMGKQVQEETDAIDGQIKQYLGDENYTEFQAYEKSLPDRMAVSGFKDQQGTGPGALTPEQEDQLITAMSDERQKFKFTINFGDKSKMDMSDLGSMFTEEKINQFTKESEQLDEKYLARAQAFLSPDQQKAFKDFLSAQETLRVGGMKIASQMFGGKGSK